MGKLHLDTNNFTINVEGGGPKVPSLMVSE